MTSHHFSLRRETSDAKDNSANNYTKYGLRHEPPKNISCIVIMNMSMPTSLPSNEPSEGFITNDNLRIHYYVAGQGPLLVLLHGFPDNAESFRPQLLEFSKKYTVVCPTLRGYSPSDTPDDSDAYQLGLVVEDILAILNHFKAEKAVVGGHDFGGAAIQLLSLLHPDRVAGLIIINSPIVPRFYDLVNFDDEQQKLSVYTIPYINYQPGDPIDIDYTVRNIRDDSRRKAVRDYLATVPVHGMLAYYKKNFPGPPYGQKVNTSMMLYQVPTLIIWGLEDEYFSLKMLDSIPQHFKESTRLVTIPHAGHWAFRDQPSKVNREVWSWLAELKSDNHSE